MRASTSVVSTPGHQTLHSGNSPLLTRLLSAPYMPTAWTATVSVATYAWSLPGATSTTIVIEICTACGQPAVNDL